MGSRRSNATSSKGLKPSKPKETKGKGPSKSTETKGKKRCRSSISEDDDPSNVEDSGVNVSVKRHKDVQTATSRSLLIPVDETCPLAGKKFDHKPPPM